LQGADDVEAQPRNKPDRIPSVRWVSFLTYG
jgi:hypothetical protein